MAKIKVNVVIAGRTYPLSVNNTNEEQGMRIAAKNVNDLIANFEQNYAVADKQDALAMCALQFASKSEIVSINSTKETTEIINKINDLTTLLDKHL